MHFLYVYPLPSNVQHRLVRSQHRCFYPRFQRVDPASSPLAAGPGWFCSRKPKPWKNKQFWLQSFNLPSDQIDLLLVFIWKVPLFSLCFPCFLILSLLCSSFLLEADCFFSLLHFNIDCFLLSVRVILHNDECHKILSSSSPTAPYASWTSFPCSHTE